MTSLIAEGISLNIKTARILDDVSLRVKSGEIIGLIGPNGAGKSSLLKCILGLNAPTSGQVMLDGIDINNMDLKERARQMAYAAQGAPAHWPLTALSTVNLGRVPHLSPWQEMSAEDKLAVADAMELADCTHLRGRSITTLSGGERARVMLARVMATGAPFILADEPVASLDPAHQLQVMDILRGHAHGGGACLVVLHDLSLAQRYCDRLALMDGGKMIAQGATSSILSDGYLADVFGIKVSRWENSGQSFIAPHKLNEHTKNQT